MGIKISELTEDVAVTDNDLVAVVDIETTTTKKSKLSNFFKWILNRANTWTKQQKIVSDGTNAPIVIRDSSDTKNILNSNNVNVWATGGGDVSTNTAFGTDTLLNNTTGYLNTAIGGSALKYNTTGIYNTAIGRGAMELGSTGISFNVGVGHATLRGLLTGSNNSALGIESLISITSGNYNVGFGSASGKVLADGTTPLTTLNQSLFLGASTKASANGVTNEIVIGFNAIGNGSNSVTLGADTITKTVLRGSVGVGTTTPDTTATLQVDSTTKGVLTPRMTSAQKTAISTPATGLELWDTTADTKSYKKSNGWSYAGLITETFWLRFAVGSTIAIANNTEINILNYITNADINTSVSDSFNQLSINATTNAIKTIWTGRKIIHTIRLSLFFVTGNSQFYRIELRRKVDDSIITSQTVFRNPDEAQQTVNIVTRTLSDTDPFVLDGFYIALVNNSGASTTVEDAFELLIINQYQ